MKALSLNFMASSSKESITRDTNITIRFLHKEAIFGGDIQNGEIKESQGLKIEGIIRRVIVHNKVESIIAIFGREQHLICQTINQILPKCCHNMGFIQKVRIFIKSIFLDPSKHRILSPNNKR